jgi:hypothetical protein
MRLKTGMLLLLCVSAGPLRLHADEPLYSIKIASSPHVEVVATPNISGVLSMYPFSEMMARTVKPRGGRKVLAADYAVDFVRIRTKEPSLAAQDISHQIFQQTGLILRKHINSSLAQIAPVIFLQTFSDMAVVNLLLTPTKEPDVYQVSCSYLIEERPPGSNDGTPAAREEVAKQMKELQEMMARQKAEAAKAK